MLADMEVQRTIRRVELRAFTSAFASLIGPSSINAGCIGPKQDDADFWNILGVADGVCRAEFGSGRRHTKQRKGKNTTTEMQEIGTEGSEKAD